MTPFNPELDLELIRVMKATPAQVWRCWTEPELLKQWWAPKPVIVRDAVIEPTAGGRFHSMMILPDGAEHPTEGCILLAEPERRLVFTDALEKGFRPATKPMFGFTAFVTMTPQDGGTLYHARALHKSPEIAKQHSDMGFHEGWGTVATQLDELAQTL